MCGLPRLGVGPRQRCGSGGEGSGGGGGGAAAQMGNCCSLIAGMAFQMCAAAAHRFPLARRPAAPALGPVLPSYAPKRQPSRR